jgi:hypothetical protein
LLQKNLTDLHKTAKGGHHNLTTSAQLYMQNKEELTLTSYAFWCYRFHNQKLEDKLFRRGKYYHDLTISEIMSVQQSTKSIMSRLLTVEETFNLPNTEEELVAGLNIESHMLGPVGAEEEETQYCINLIVTGQNKE